MSLLFPLAVPAAYKAAPGDGELFKLTISAILAGAVFGDHWCAYSLFTRICRGRGVTAFVMPVSMCIAIR